MNESLGDRFRRIVDDWREQQGQPGASSEPVVVHVGQEERPGLEPEPVPPSLKAEPAQPEVEMAVTDLSTESPAEPTWDPTPIPDEIKTPAKARQFLERLRAKTDQVVQDCTDGVINQNQFEAIYSHYQRQRIAVEKALIEMPGSGAWRAAAVEGHTTFLRQQHAATVLNYGIYETTSLKALAQVGDGDIDSQRLTSLLTDLGAQSKEQSVHQLEIDDGRVLAVVEGRFSILVAIFSAEPATLQLQMIQDLHRDFELLSDASLSHDDLSQLALTFIGLWAFEHELSEA